MIDQQPDDDTTFLYELARDSETSALVGYLKRSEKPIIRERTAELLGDFSNHPNADEKEEIVEALIQAIQEDDHDGVRARAIDALYRHGQESFDRLIEELADFDLEEAPDWVTARTLAGWLDAEYPEFRMTAAAALGRLGDEKTLPALADALSDSDPRVRARAATSCGMIGDSRCIPALEARLQDNVQLVREAAANALGMIGTREALEPLIPVARDGDEPLRRIAVDELGQYGSLEPVVVLTRALTHDTEPIQRCAILSLIQLFSEAPPEQSQEVRITVAEQLQRAETAAVVPQLVEVLEESTRWSIRRNAVWLLGRVTDGDSDYRDDIYDCLIEALDDDDETTAQLAAASLAELESDDLERRLHVLLGNERGSAAARKRAEYVLEQIGSAPESELVTNSVNYTYVSDPADYTRKKRQRERDAADSE